MYTVEVQCRVGSPVIDDDWCGCVVHMRTTCLMSELMISEQWRTDGCIRDIRQSVMHMSNSISYILQLCTSYLVFVTTHIISRTLHLCHPSHNRMDPPSTNAKYTNYPPHDFAPLPPKCLTVSTREWDVARIMWGWRMMDAIL